MRPCRNAQVSVTLPGWLEPKDAFEVTPDGVRDVSWKREDGSVTLALGTVQISSFVVVTADAGLRGRLQDRYQNMFAANVAKIRAGTKQGELPTEVFRARFMSDAQDRTICLPIVGDPVSAY